jgi:hypothetical protein
MKQQVKNYLVIIILLAVLVVPSFALASWWNPFSWGFWNSIFHSQTQQQKLINGDKEKNCPQYMPPSSDFCKGGNIVGGGLDTNGCQLPPKCEMPLNQSAEWKTYTNTRYGYEIKYPSDITISREMITETDFGVAQGLNFMIEVTQNYINSDAAIKMAETNIPVVAASAGYTYSYKTSDIIINGSAGKKITINYSNKSDGKPFKTFTESYLDKGNSLFSFFCDNYSYSSENTKYDCSTLDKMVSTFKFTK